MADKFRWGVLSTADIGTEHVIPATQRSARGEVLAIGSRSETRAREVADALSIPRAYGSYEALLEDPDIDGIYNPLPNHLHAEWTMAAAEAGKHVLCEKPLALTAAQAEEMIAACDAAGVKLAEAFMYRLHPQWARVRELVASGRLGEIRAIHSWFSYNNTDPTNIRNIVDYGGGGVMDIGCYNINVSRMLFGAEPDEVHAVVHRDPEFGTDDLVSALLRFGEAQASFTCSTQVENRQSVRVVGSEGILEVEVPFNIPADRPGRLFHTYGNKPPESAPVDVIETEAADHYGVQADAFAAAVLDDTDVPLSNADSIANMKVIERVLAAG